MVYFDQTLLEYTAEHCLGTGMQDGDEALQKNRSPSLPPPQSILEQR